MGVFDYLEDAQPFLDQDGAADARQGAGVARQFSLVRGTARRMRYRLYRARRCLRLHRRGRGLPARHAGLARHRLVRLDSSGGGWVLVGEHGDA